MNAKFVLSALLLTFAAACAQQPATQEPATQNETVDAIQVTYYYLPG